MQSGWVNKHDNRSRSCTWMFVLEQNGKWKNESNYNTVRNYKLKGQFATLWRTGIGVVVTLRLGVWLWRVGGQSGRSEDVLTGPTFSSCIHAIVWKEMYIVRTLKKTKETKDVMGCTLARFWLSTRLSSNASRVARVCLGLQPSNWTYKSTRIFFLNLCKKAI